MNSLKKKFSPVWIGLLLITAVFLIYSGNREVKVEITGSDIIILGGYGEATIPFKDLLLVDTVSVLPEIVSKTNGHSFGDTKSGDFQLADGKGVKLFIKEGDLPYLLIKSKNHEPVYLNFEDKQKTIKLYQEISDKINRNDNNK